MPGVDDTAAAAGQERPCRLGEKRAAASGQERLCRLGEGLSAVAVGAVGEARVMEQEPLSVALEDAVACGPGTQQEPSPTATALAAAAAAAAVAPAAAAVCRCCRCCCRTDAVGFVCCDRLVPLSHTDARHSGGRRRHCRLHQEGASAMPLQSRLSQHCESLRQRYIEHHSIRTHPGSCSVSSHITEL